MPRELLILRHAKSDWETPAASDYDRPLAARGKLDAPRMGAWLKHEGLKPDGILSSPAKRARQTALRVAKSAGVSKGAITWDGELYAASLGELLTALGRVGKGGRRVLLVGHNPGLEELLEYLAGTVTPLYADGKILPTATVARLQMPKDWRQLMPGCAQVISITRPGELPL